MFLLLIAIFLIYSVVKGSKHKEYSLLELFKYEKVKKPKYQTRRSRGVL